MPPATFDPDALRASLKPLLERSALSSQAITYRQFYGIDLAHRGVAVEGLIGRMAVGPFDIVTQLWLPARPVATLFLLHGFYDHMGLYRHVIDWALEQNFAVIACDLPGHGLSSGPRASIDDFAHYQQVLQALFAEAEQLRLPQPWHLCGQSTGGAIAVDHLLHCGSDTPIQGQTLLLAPLVRPRAWGWSKLSYRLLKPFVSGIDRRFSENTNDPAFMPFLQADPLQPLRLPTAWVGALVRWVARIEAAPACQRSPLIVQGDADMTVDWQHNLKVLRSKFDQPRVLMLPEARHHLANELPRFREEYFRFLTNALCSEGARPR
jgi:alpha-beta hydrolase superfamily lysophospholipase